MHIRKDDTVIVLSGDDAGKKGTVLRVDPKNDQIVVQGVNVVYKHVKPNRRSPQGGRLSKEMPIHISKVALVDAEGKPTRTGVRYRPDGTKEIYAKTTGATIRVISKPRPKYAKKTETN